MKQFAFVSLIVVVGIAICWIGNAFGLWFAAFIEGILLGLLLRSWMAFGVSVIVGGLGWGLPLAYLGLSAPIVRLASLVGSAALSLGAGGDILIITITILLGVLLCVTGTWLAIALRRLIVSLHLLPMPFLTNRK